MPRHGKYERDINRVLRRYALVPIAILLMVSYTAAVILFFQTSEKTNRMTCSFVAEELGGVISSYMQMAETFSEDPDILRAMAAGKEEPGIYARLYSFVNSQSLRMNFYIYDLKGRQIFKSWALRSDGDFTKNSGFVARTIAGQGRAQLSAEVTGYSVLTVSCALMDGQNACGILLFDMDTSQLDALIQNRGPVDLLVINRYYNVCYSTNTSYSNQYGKLERAYREEHSWPSWNRQNFMVSREALPAGGLQVVAITQLGDYPYLFTLLGVILVGFFILLFVFIFMSSRVIAHRKTKVIDELCEAISYVQSGDFNHPVSLKTGDEFEQIADAYNAMLKDIQRLMSENEERAYLASVSELKQLEAQFNPHFLFNTFEIIRYNLFLAPETVEKAIMDMASILRYSLNITRYVTLKEDIQYAESYLRIQYLRHEGHIKSEIKIEGPAYNCLIPKLIIQPILENAFKYGFNGQDEFCIWLHAYVQNDWLVIKIANNGKPIEDHLLEEIQSRLKGETNSSGQFGLFSVNRRIVLLYGTQYGLTIESKQDRTEFTLTLPAWGDEAHVQNSNR